MKTLTYADGFRDGAEDVLDGHRVGWPQSHPGKPEPEYTKGYKAAVRAARQVLAAGYTWDGENFVAPAEQKEAV